MKRKILNIVVGKGFLLSCIFAVLAGILSFLAFHEYLSSLQSTVLFSLVIGGYFGLLFYIFSELIRTRKSIEDKLYRLENELRSVIGINKLTQLPMYLGGWAITGQFLQALVEEIYLRKPQLIVECGSGTSTIVSASCLKKIGKGKVLSLDHESYFADKTRKLLGAENIDEFAHVVTASIETLDINGESWKWYGADFEKLIDSPIDILVVDGPPASLQSQSRYPAVPLLKQYLAEDCLILLDDGLRDDEADIAKQWAELLGVEAVLDSKNRGFWKIIKGNA